MIHFSFNFTKIVAQKYYLRSLQLFSKLTFSRSRKFYGAPLNDGMWHSLCVTWTSANGIWSAYVDGKTNVRRSGDSLRKNHVIEFNGGHLVLGQKIQDDAFAENRAFAGNISRVNLWDYAMNKDQVRSVAKGCASPAGNVLKWRHFRNGLQGSVELSEKSQCIGAGELKDPTAISK